MAMAYKNIKVQLKPTIAMLREVAVTRRITRHMGDDKKITRKEKEECILWEKNEADSEATTYSVF